MTDEKILIPMNLRFCIDLIRFSDGQLTPEKIGKLAEQQILGLFEADFDTFGPAYLGERADEFGEVYGLELSIGDPEKPARNPLIWKNIAFPHGSEVRMSYSGDVHFAKVVNGFIEDTGNKYSPSEWASKVARGTSRNAWRDLWFKKPHSSKWLPAHLIREAHNATRGGSENEKN